MYRAVHHPLDPSTPFVATRHSASRDIKRVGTLTYRRMRVWPIAAHTRKGSQGLEGEEGYQLQAWSEIGSAESERRRGRFRPFNRSVDG